MDQRKTGEVLRELRKEKGLTQEQLAEKFNVSGRTVSRWETGSNMPDISILVELADFYETDIREIIDGERKSEKMNSEMNETIMKVADYEETKRACLLGRMRILSILGFIGLNAALLTESFARAGVPIVEYIKGAGYELAAVTLVTMILYTTGILAKMFDRKEQNKVIIRIILALCALAVLGSLTAAVRLSL